ncbi:beta-L-arabinofuranosidase domain-containing protein [Occultella kanbiaonis]|uniref:beta-L-arabinofuranosidase domain-containing protein n=1 Tax=Occultella kanbiaonis TaxID=2675754 RepID=UPI0012B6EC32|nr:beta-L-arabinofuranosidase domain-containing protein [Occultella kanbiaonis]
MSRRRVERSERVRAQEVLRPLGHTGRVRIESGPLAERIADAADTYLAMDPDDVLHGFRTAAGRAAPGAPLTGWSTVTSEPTFGQWVSGLARLGVTAGVAAASERAIELVDGFAETVGPDGDVRMSLYGYEKLICGLVDTFTHTGHEPALALLERTVPWADRTFDRARPTPSARDFAGGRIGPTSHARTLEWYTLAENLHRAWLAGADERVGEFAREWHYDAYWDRFLTEPQPGLPWPVPTWLHAYSHLNTFASAAAAYEATGEDRYLEIVRNAHTYFTTTQTFATGGYGPSEFTLPEDGALGRSLEWRTDSAEIVCGSWAAFKVSAALLTYTGEARYGDWVEQLVYSGIGAVTPVRPGGRTPYYQDYRLGVATKLPHWDDWPCCSGTYLQCVSELPNFLYYAADDGLAVLLYVPSTVSWEHEGREFGLTLQTSFPQTDDARLTLRGSGHLALRLRVPSWSDGFAAAVNGEPVPAVATAGGWLVIDRDWCDGDVIDVTIGAGLRVLPVDARHPNRVAFAHGPVVLAQKADWTMPISLPTPWEMVDLDQAFEPGDGVRYTPVGVGTARLPLGDLRPLSEIAERTPYRVYFDLDDPRIV